MFYFLAVFLGWATHSAECTYSIISVFSYITVVLIFLWYLVLLFTFYLFLEDPKLPDPGVDNLLEIISNELYVAVIPILVILLITTPTFPLL